MTERDFELVELYVGILSAISIMRGLGEALSGNGNFPQRLLIRLDQIRQDTATLARDIEVHLPVLETDR